jgi:hypothetical protein
MRLLFGSDERIAKAESELGDVNLLVLDDASPEQLDAVVNYVWAVKQLLYDLAHDRAMESPVRIANATDLPISLAELAALTDIPSSIFVSAQQRWFPKLDTEVERWRAGDRAAILNDTLIATTLSDRTYSNSGWYIDDRDGTIRYQPTQHADQFLRTWLEVSARANSHSTGDRDGDRGLRLEPRGAMHSVFLSLTRSTSPGRCVKCHTVDKQANGDYSINWHGAPASERWLTKFSHSPHVSQHRENCASCHDLDKEVHFFRAEFLHQDLAANVDPHSVNTSGFVPAQVTDCTGCHSPRGGARETCLTCHNYHAVTPQYSWQR